MVILGISFISLVFEIFEKTIRKLRKIMRIFILAFFQMIFFSYAIRYMLENFFELMMTFILEISAVIEKARALYTPFGVFAGLSCLSFLFIIAVIVFWILILVFVGIWFYKIKEKSILFCLKDSLSSKRTQVIIFYIVFLIQRIIISLFVGLAIFY